MDETIINYLEKLDLSESEAKLYLTILSVGGKTFRELAQILGVNRSTTFINAERLIEKELIIKVVKNKKTLLFPNEPKIILKNLVDKKTQSTQSIKQQLPDMVDELQKKFSPLEKFDNAEIKRYKGKLGIKRIYEDALKTNELRCNANFKDNFDLSDIEGMFFQVFDKNPDFIMYELLADTPFARQYPLFHKKRYFRKFLPPHIKLSTAEIFIYDEKVSIINFNNNIVGTVLHNTDYYLNTKNMFDFIWQLLPEAT